MAETKPLGDSGLTTPRLVLGGNVFGFTVKGEEAFRRARPLRRGRRHHDRYRRRLFRLGARAMSAANPRRLLGEWLKRRGRRDDVLIATKVGYGRSGALGPRGIAAAAEASLERLGTDHIDLYYAHKDDAGTPLEETLAAFDRLVRDGKVRAIGASNYSAERLAEALDSLGARGAGRATPCSSPNII